MILKYDVPPEIAERERIAANTAIAEGADWSVCPHAEARELMRLSAIERAETLARNGWEILTATVIYRSGPSPDPMEPIIPTAAIAFKFEVRRHDTPDGKVEQYGAWLPCLDEAPVR
jgi:hypothetical protein